MKKLSFVLTLMFVSLFLWSCGSSDEGSNEKTEITPVNNAKVQKQSLTQSMLIGEWVCVDITNGVIHMTSIAKMQPHMIFSSDGEIHTKQKLSDGNFVEQKYANYKINNGVVVSEVFEVNPYIENKQLIIENPSEDNKRIYTKIGE